MDEEVLREKFIGSLLGTFVGDALGMPVEGCSLKDIGVEYGEVKEMLPARLGPGTYTDDTEMMIGVAESLIECRGFDGEDMARRFLENFHRERGYGFGTIQALSLLRDGVSWDRAGDMVFAGGSFGNGSAMRVAPVGLFYFDDPDGLRGAAYGSSRITHSHTIGKEGAALQAYAVALAVNREIEGGIDGSGFLEKLKRFLNPEAREIKDKIDKTERLLSRRATKEEVIEALGHDSRAHHSVPAAIYSFLSHPEDFENAVVYAIGLGGDTDTIGAMTGAIAGAFHGKGAIPERWLKVLESKGKGRDYIEALSVKLWEMKTT